MAREARTSTVVVLMAVLAIGVAAALTATGFGEASHRLSVAAVRQPATSLFFVGQENGCFRAEGLELSERTFELGRDALLELLAGEADVAIAYETPVLARYRGDRRLRVISALHSSTHNTRVIARRDRGIESIADLRGRRVGAAAGTNADFFVEHLLTFGGMTRADLEVVDLQPGAAPEALANGSIDAAVLSDPHAERARRALGGNAVELVSDLYAEFSMLATRADVIESRRPALLALLRGFVCAERALADEPARSFAAVRARFPERSGSELQLALERVRRSIGLDEVLWSVLVREARWLYASRDSPDPPPDLDLLIDPTLLREVEPAAVNLLMRR